jgi:hypothetical protein
VCDDLDDELPRGLRGVNGLALDVRDQGGEQVFNQGARDEVDVVYPTKGRSRDLGESEVFDLPGSREDEDRDFESKEKRSLT